MNIAESITLLSMEFQIAIPKIFGSNLVFGFIGGGLAKGYADYSHDIDMAVICKERNPTHDENYKEFFYTLHEKYGFKTENNPTIDISFGIASDIDKLHSMLNILDHLTVTPIVQSFDTFEAVVWGDMMSSTVIGLTGDVQYFKTVQNKCATYKDRWRKQIIENCIGNDTFSVEKSFVDNTDLTLLFERFVTYLKDKKEISVKPYTACILNEGSAYASHVRKIIETTGTRLFPVTALTGDTTAAPEIELLIVLPSDGELWSELKDLGNVFAGRTILDLSQDFLFPLSWNTFICDAYGKDSCPDAYVTSDIPAVPSRRHRLAFYPQERAIRANACKIANAVLGVAYKDIYLYRSILHAELDATRFSGVLPHGVIDECQAIAHSLIGHIFTAATPVMDDHPPRRTMFKTLGWMAVAAAHNQIETPHLNTFLQEDNTLHRQVPLPLHDIFLHHNNALKLDLSSNTTCRMLTTQTSQSLQIMYEKE